LSPPKFLLREREGRERSGEEMNRGAKVVSYFSLKKSKEHLENCIAKANVERKDTGLNKTGVRARDES